MLHPSQVVGPDLKELCLAYISIPNMLEHYNTCEPMTTVYEDGDNTGENCPTSVGHWKAVLRNTSTNTHRTSRTNYKVRHTGQEKN